MRVQFASNVVHGASIDYSINILSTPAVPACQRFATACQPQLLTPAQAALAYALGTVQGRAFAVPVAAHGSRALPQPL